MKEKMNLSDLWGGCIWSSSKPMTNADRIRGMSDEELAEWIAQIWKYHTRAASNPYKDECDINCPLYRCCDDKPYDNIEDWLKAPVDKEGEG